MLACSLTMGGFILYKDDGGDVQDKFMFFLQRSEINKPSKIQGESKPGNEGGAYNSKRSEPRKSGTRSSKLLWNGKVCRRLRASGEHNVLVYKK